VARASLEVSGRDLDDARNLAGSLDPCAHRPLDRHPDDAVFDHPARGAGPGGVHRGAGDDLIIDLKTRPFAPFQKKIYLRGSF